MTGETKDKLHRLFWFEWRKGEWRFWLSSRGYQKGGDVVDLRGKTTSSWNYDSVKTAKTIGKIIITLIFLLAAISNIKHW